MLVRAKNKSNEVMKRLTLAKNHSNDAFNASSHCCIVSSLHQSWCPALQTVKGVLHIQIYIVQQLAEPYIMNITRATRTASPRLVATIHFQFTVGCNRRRICIKMLKMCFRYSDGESCDRCTSFADGQTVKTSILPRPPSSIIFTTWEGLSARVQAGTYVQYSP
jgi:hypothetical protein